MAYEDWRPRLNWIVVGEYVCARIEQCRFAMGAVSVRRGRMDGMRVALLAGGAFTVSFWSGRYWPGGNWCDGLFRRDEPAIAFFYLITGCTGCICWRLVAGQNVRQVWGDFDVARIRRSVELCTFTALPARVWLSYSVCCFREQFGCFVKLCGIK